MIMKKAAGVLFGNGKIIVTGVKSLENGKDVISNLRNIIKVIDPKIKRGKLWHVTFVS